MTIQDKYIQSNRAMWNVTASVHKDSGFDAMYKQVTDPAYCSFDDIEQARFKQINLVGKSVIQLCCNNGRELITIKKAGAAHCVGIDISDNFIDQARQLAEGSGQIIEFIRSSIYDVDSKALGQFDVVYVTVGALGWLPDLTAFFDIVKSFLAKDGFFFLYEMHPILDMFDLQPPHERVASYFKHEPFKDETLPEYMDVEGVGKATSYWFTHTLGKIISQCLAHNLTLVHFDEYAHDVSGTYAALDGDAAALPMSYSLLAQNK